MNAENRLSALAQMMTTRTDPLLELYSILLNERGEDGQRPLGPSVIEQMATMNRMSAPVGENPIQGLLAGGEYMMDSGFAPGFGVMGTVGKVGGIAPEVSEMLNRDPLGFFQARSPDEIARAFQGAPSDIQMYADSFGSRAPQLREAARLLADAPSPASYVGAHSAPIRTDDGTTAPLHQLDVLYPDDIYGPMAARYYGHGEDVGMDSRMAARLAKYRNNPDALVPVWRAVPKGVDKTINPGDWVTMSRDYAVDHGVSQLGGDYEIVKKMVRADELWTDANSIYEFGYNPRETGQ